MAFLVYSQFTETILRDRKNEPPSLWKGAFLFGLLMAEAAAYGSEVPR